MSDIPTPEPALIADLVRLMSAGDDLLYALIDGDQDGDLVFALSEAWISAKRVLLNCGEEPGPSWDTLDRIGERRKGRTDDH